MTLSHRGSFRHRVPVRSLAAITVSALIAAGCGGSNSEGAGNDTEPTTSESVTTAADAEVTEESTTTEAAAEEETTTTTAVEEEPELQGSGAAPAGAPTIDVSDQGAEPRIELRYEIADGVYGARMSQVQSLSQSIDGQLASEVADLETLMEIEVTSRAVDNGYEHTSAYVDIGMAEGTDPTTASAAQSQFDELIGASFVATIDARGIILDQQFIPSPDTTAGSATEAMLESIAGQSQFANVLPEEPMGVGGSWRQTQELTLNGIDVTQVTTYTVTAIDGTVVTLSVDGQQVVEPGPVQFPGLPSGVEVSVDAWDVGTAGTVQLDLSRPVPASEATVTGSQTLVGSGAEEFTLVQDLTNVTTITPVG